MSGRFPKCLTPGCRRLLFRRTGSQQLTCGGCQQTYQVDNLSNAEQNASLEKPTSDVYLKQQRDTYQPNEPEDDIQRPYRTSSYPVVNKHYTNALESSGGHNRNSSGSSFGSEEYVAEKEKNSKPSLEKPTSDVSLKQQRDTYQPNEPEDDIQRPYRTSSYPVVNKNYTNALESLGGHNRNSSGSSFGSEEYVTEKEKNSKPEKSILPPRRPSSYSASISSRSISSDEGGSYISRNTNAVSRRTHRRGTSIASTAESIDEIQIINGTRYDTNYEEEKIKAGLSETNYPHNEFEIDRQSDSAQGRIISEKELEGRKQESTFYENFSYQTGRDLNSSFDETVFYGNRNIPFRHEPKNGQVEALKRVPYGTNYPLNQSKINQNGRSDLIDDNSSVQGSIISEEDIEERAYPGGRNSYASFEGSTSSRSLSSEEGGSRRIGPGGRLFRSQRTYRSHGSGSDGTYDDTYSAAQSSVSREHSELQDLVSELAKIGLTREKLLTVLLKQTEASIKDEQTNQNRNTRSLVRKLSVQIPPTHSSDSGSIRSERRRPVAHRCRPMLGGTPFVTCQSCSMLLQLPILMPKKRFVKIRCGACSDIQVCPLPAKGMMYNPLHKALGYGSARMLMAPSRQFSLMDDDQ